MDDDAHTSKPSGEPPTPEVAELLRMLEIQAAARRVRHAPAASRFGTGSFRYGSLIIIVLFAFGSLGLLEWLLSQMPKPAHPQPIPAPSLATPEAKGSAVSGTAR